MPSEKPQLLEEFKQWILFVEALQQRDESVWNTPIAEGKWTIREIVSHILLWDKYFLDESINKISIKSSLTNQDIDFNEFNYAAKIYGRITSIDALVEEAITYRGQIIKQIEAFSDDEYLNVYIDGDGSPFEVPQYLKDFIWHDQHHMVPINNLINAD
jgi:uncharacterized damage-inducible protein DinB